MNVLKRHKNTFWYLLTTVYKKKGPNKNIKELIRNRKRSRRETSLKSDLKAELERGRALEEGKSERACVAVSSRQFKKISLLAQR